MRQASFSVASAEHCPSLDMLLGWALRVDALPWALQVVLVLVRHTQALRAHLQATSDLDILRLLLRLVLDHLFALRIAAEGHEDELALVEVRAEVLPLVHRNQPLISLLQGAVVHLGVDIIEGALDVLDEFGDIARDLSRFGIRDVSLGHDERALLNVHGPELDAQGDALHLPVVELPAWGMVTLIKLDANARLRELHVEIHCGVFHLVPLRVRAGSLQADSHNDHLEASNWRWQHQAFVVTMHHGHYADRSLRDAPRVLIRKLLLLPRSVIGILELDLEHLREVLAEVVRRCTLNSTPRRGDEGLDSRRVVRTREGLSLRLRAPDNRNRKQLFVDQRVELKDVENFLLGGRLVCKSSVALLPQELSCPQEGCRLLHLPADHAAPLVQLDWQIPVGLNPVGVGRIHGSLARWPNRHRLLDVTVAKLGDHGQLRGEVIQVV
mmetsp:Transcript_4968/g.12067  ORF Transcript_4968/g.12067 Transcript_4968/m.12067 type:complete len:440 (+) Transcript_4968:100-1419(+)